MTTLPLVKGDIAPSGPDTPAAGSAHPWIRYFRKPLPIAIIVALGSALRLFPIRSIWLDEAISVQQARLPYWQMIYQLRSFDVHPPIWASVLWLDVRLFGFGPLAVRLPSLALGIASIPLTYLVGRELFDRRAGIVAALFVAASPIAVWYSGEARMYSIYIFLSLLALLAQAKIINCARSWYWLLFIVSSAALFYTHYFSIFQIVAQHLIFIGLILTALHRKQPLARRLAVPWLLSGLATVLLVLPLLPYLASQTLSPPGPVSGTGGKSAISLYGVLANLVWAGWGYHSDDVMLHATALWPAAMLGVLLLLGKGRSRSTILLGTLVMVPLLSVYALGSLVSPTVFELRYFISILPPALLLAARAATSWLSGKWAMNIAVSAIVASMLVALGDEQFDASNPRLYDYRGAFDVIRSEAHPGDTLIYAPAFLAPVISYYRPGLTPVAVGEASPALDSQGTVFIMASFLDEPDTASAVGGALSQQEQRGRSARQIIHRANVTVWVMR